MHTHLLRALCTLTLGCALLACTDDKRDDADAGAKPAASALDRPDTLSRPPAGKLPDDLRPPR